MAPRIKIAEAAGEPVMKGGVVELDETVVPGVDGNALYADESGKGDRHGPRFADSGIAG
jgi:hypothetical protein